MSDATEQFGKKIQQDKKPVESAPLSEESLDEESLDKVTGGSAAPSHKKTE